MNDATSTTKLCLIGKVIADVPDEYRDALLRIVNVGPKEGGLAIQEAAHALHFAGLKASASSIYLHRSGRCTCARGNAWNLQNSTDS